MKLQEIIKLAHQFAKKLENDENEPDWRKISEILPRDHRISKLHNLFDNFDLLPKEAENDKKYLATNIFSLLLDIIKLEREMHPRNLPALKHEFHKIFDYIKTSLAEESNRPSFLSDTIW